MQALVIDDHPPIRRSMTTTLKRLAENQQKEIQVFDVGGCEEALSMDAKDEIDLILLDYHLPGGMEGIEALTAIKDSFPSSQVVVYSGESDPDLILETIENGAGGFIHKSFDDELTIHSLETILKGGIVLPPQAIGGLRTDAHSLPPPDQRRRTEIVEKLSDKQMQVLELAVRGNRNDQIAAQINRSTHTVKKHLSEAYHILNVSSRTEAVYVSSQLKLFGNDNPH